MLIERLGIDHMDLLAPRLRLANAGLSEYTFANLYLLRASHDYHVLRDREIFIRLCARGDAAQGKGQAPALKLKNVRTKPDLLVLA